MRKYEEEKNKNEKHKQDASFLHWSVQTHRCRDICRLRSDETTCEEFTPLPCHLPTTATTDRDVTLFFPLCLSLSLSLSVSVCVSQCQYLCVEPERERCDERNKNRKQDGNNLKYMSPSLTCTPSITANRAHTSLLIHSGKSPTPAAH